MKKRFLWFVDFFTLGPSELKHISESQRDSAWAGSRSCQENVLGIHRSIVV